MKASLKKDTYKKRVTKNRSGPGALHTSLGVRSDWSPEGSVKTVESSSLYACALKN